MCMYVLNSTLISLPTMIALYPRSLSLAVLLKSPQANPRLSWALGASQAEVACVPVVAIGGLTLQGTGTLGHRAAAAGGGLFDTGSVRLSVRSNHCPMTDASHDPCFS